MKVIDMFSGKGGVGKSPLGVEMAARFALMGKRVLGIDTDWQSQFTVGLGAEPSNGLYDLVSARNPDISALVTPTRIKNLSLITSGSETNTAAAVAAAKHYQRTWLADTLEKVADKFDVCIIDTAQGGLFVEMSIAAADLILSPVFCKFAHLEALTGTPVYVSQVRASVGREYPPTVVVPICGGGSKHATDMYAQLQEQIGRWQPDPLSPHPLDKWTLFEVETIENGEIVGAPVPITVEIDNAKSQVPSLTLMEYRPKHPVTAAYNKLAAELASVLWGEG